MATTAALRHLILNCLNGSHTIAAMYLMAQWNHFKYAVYGVAL